MCHAVNKRRDTKAKPWNYELYNAIIQPLLSSET